MVLMMMMIMMMKIQNVQNLANFEAKPSRFCSEEIFLFSVQILFFSVVFYPNYVMLCYVKATQVSVTWMLLFLNLAL